MLPLPKARVAEAGGQPNERLGPLAQSPRAPCVGGARPMAEASDPHHFKSSARCPTVRILCTELSGSLSPGWLHHQKHLGLLAWDYSVAVCWVWFSMPVAQMPPFYRRLGHTG